jgi:hypothetical protein
MINTALIRCYDPDDDWDIWCGSTALGDEVDEDDDD